MARTLSMGRILFVDFNNKDIFIPHSVFHIIAQPFKLNSCKCNNNHSKHQCLRTSRSVVKICKRIAKNQKANSGCRIIGAATCHKICCLEHLE